MRRFKSVFRASKPDSPDLAVSRSVWSRRHRSTEGEPVKPEPGATSQEITGDESRPATAESASAHVKSSSAATAPTDNAVGESESNRQSAGDTGDFTRSKHGTNRLKKMVARFRSSSSRDEDPVAEPQPQSEQQDARTGKTTTKPLTSNTFEPGTTVDPNPAAGKSVRFDDPKERRKASAQMTHSQESSQTEDTVCRDRSQHIPLRIPEPWEEWGWPGLMLYEPEQPLHVHEGSDPFSDGKATDVRQTRSGSSRHSAGQSRDESRTSEGTLDPIPEIDVDAIGTVVDPPQAQPSNTERAGSTNSQSSRMSWSSTLDGPKATSAFNRLASHFGIRIAIPVEDATVSPPAESTPVAEEDDTGRRGFRLRSKVRKVRSNLTADTTPLAPTPKLRRMKTFANLRRPSRSMTSLQGRSIETLARLGGHGYLMLADLAPCPVQLPACIVATLMFLHKYGLDTPGLFIQPGNLKAAIRMYDHFAEQVFEAEKDEAKISLTMRVVAMPQLREDSAPVLSVAWALKALLAGLPNGILGSVRLYQVLKEMYNSQPIPDQSHLVRVPDCISEASPPTAARVQLICLALIALAPEMQRDLICAAFGLLSLMVNASNVQGQQSGMELREPVANPNFHELARAFGPLLLGSGGQENQDGTAQVEQEINDQRVAGLLLNNWHFVHRQLQHWTSGQLVSKE